MRDWTEANKDRVNAQRRARRQSNLEHVRTLNNARNRRWGQTEKGRINAVARQHRRRSRHQGTPNQEWLGILRKDPCSYCNLVGGETDHIVPVASGGTSDWDNFTGACRRCNASKANRSLLVWMADA